MSFSHQETGIAPCASTQLRDDGIAGNEGFTKVSLWLGHAQMQTTEVHLKADPTEKLETIETMTHPHLRRGHFRPVDKLLAALRAPKNMRS